MSQHPLQRREHMTPAQVREAAAHDAEVAKWADVSLRGAERKVYKSLDAQFGMDWNWDATGLTQRQYRAACQRLRRKGLAQCGFGTMHWSWFRVDRTLASGRAS